MIISFVVAAAENNIIGKNNGLLWHLPNDMAFFKNTTWGMPVIMGRKTYESLGKPLEGRKNIIITHQRDYSSNGITVVNNLKDALIAAEKEDVKEVFIIGGGAIFHEALPMADKIFLTRVHASFEGDASIPEIDPGEWKMVSDKPFEADAKHAYSYSFQLWERKKINE